MESLAERLSGGALALLTSSLAAFAVDLGFGGAFVIDAVAWTTAAYATALAVVVAGRNRESAHYSERLWLRIPLAVTVSGGWLLLLRGPLLFPLPLSEFSTTGHSPYVVFPVSALSCLLLLWLLRGVSPRPVKAE